VNQALPSLAEAADTSNKPTPLIVHFGFKVGYCPGLENRI
jgi:hypothetical protein